VQVASAMTATATALRVPPRHRTLHRGLPQPGCDGRHVERTHHDAGRLRRLPPNFVTLVEMNHGYPHPATALRRTDGSVAPHRALCGRQSMMKLLTTTGNPNRMFNYTSDAPFAPFASSSFVRRQARSGGHHLSLEAILPGVSSLPHVLSPYSELPTGRAVFPQQQTKVQGESDGSLTNFSWVEKMPSFVVTPSFDMMCTGRNLDTSSAVTQLIAHDRLRHVRRRSVAQLDVHILCRRGRLVEFV
jgi:hypothetical protein